ncbi:MAG TPA: sigma-70 family RNA polymerase sigma factor [Gemmataceae bacterium]|nr:sigma-70 family RNA polymerase sigma factor [Gemmataceae bacterium]
MTTKPLTRLLGQVRRTLAAHHEDDGDLLARFRDGRDLAALDGLVRKHAPLVLAACRKVLPDADADDVFQATFLVLMRDARRIRKGQSVGSWLYGVAHRLALQARANQARRSRIEGRSRAESRSDSTTDLSWKEACAALHEELDRLPDSYRLALLLCYLEGKSRDEAATELGWTLNRVRGQLERGRERLRKRLERRGIALSAGLLAAVAGNSVLAGGPPARLVQAAMRAAAGRPSAEAASIAHGVPRMTPLAKVAVSASLLTVALAVGLGQAPPPPAKAEPPAKEAQTAKPAATDPLAPITVECTGRVVDPDGKPVAAAKVTYLQDPLREDPQALYPEPSTGMTDRDGKFRFPVSMYPQGPSGHQPMGRLTAIVPGFAPAGTGTGMPESFKDRTLKLDKDDVPLENRFLDLEGKPIAGVTARCVAVIVSPNNNLGIWLKDIKENKLVGGATTPGMPIPVAQLGLTQSATSDKDGRIKLTGIGRGRVAFVRIDGPGIESHMVWIMTANHDTVRVPQHPNAFSLFADQPVYGPKADIAVAPCTPVEGMVKDLDTGKPIAGATVFNLLNAPYGMPREKVETKTDGQGHYRLDGRPNRTGYRVTVIPPPGEPYLLTADYPPRVEPGKTAALNFNVKRGVFITGKVTDQATGKPLRAAIEYKTWGDNPNLKGIHPVWRIRTTTTADGTYQLVGLPGRGLITANLDELRRGRCVVGAGAEAVKGREMEGESFRTVPDRTFPSMVNSLTEVDAKADAQNVCHLTITTGRTVKGTLADPDGKPLTGVRIDGAIGSDVHLPPQPKAEFTITAVNPSAPKPYFFHQAEKNLAVAVILKGDEPEGFTVRLQKAATITGRLLGDGGEPLPDTEISGAIDDNQLGLKGGWGGFFYGKTDKEGKFRIAGLVPGVKQSACVMRRYQTGEQIFEHQAFGVGEVRDLGDVKVKAKGE